MTRTTACVGSSDNPQLGEHVGAHFVGTGAVLNVELRHKSPLRKDLVTMQFTFYIGSTINFVARLAKLREQR